MSDARTLLDDLRRKTEKLHYAAEEAKKYIERAEPHEALRPLNDGRNTIKVIEQRWEELRHLVEHL